MGCIASCVRGQREERPAETSSQVVLPQPAQNYTDLAFDIIQMERVYQFPNTASNSAEVSGGDTSPVEPSFAAPVSFPIPESPDEIVLPLSVSQPENAERPTFYTAEEVDIENAFAEHEGSDYTDASSTPGTPQSFPRPHTLPPPLAVEETSVDSSMVSTLYFARGFGQFTTGLVGSLLQPIETGNERTGVGNGVHSFIEHFARGFGQGLDRVMTMDGVSDSTLSRLGTVRGAVGAVARGNLRGWTGNVSSFMSSRLGAAWERMSSGLSHQSLDAFLRRNIITPTLDEEEPFICPICTDGIADPECDDARDFKVVRICGSHDFHLRCLREWLRRKNTCPLCRRQNVVPHGLVMITDD